MTSPLEPILRRLILENGPIDIATYMNLCLTHPEHGYYTSANHVFGRQGDFTTAPEISQLFGEMIGFWVADLWTQMGKPSSFILAELGPGRGVLMRDILRILSRVPSVMGAARVHLVEVSERRIAEQAQTLQGHDVTWHDTIDDLPIDAPLVVINNEFFDALPVRQIVKTENKIEEVVVGLSGAGRFQLGRVPCAFPGAELITGVNEISSACDTAAQLLFERIQKQTGAVLTIDYGYDAPTGQSTIQAVRGHARCEFLETPGQADLTALVDFAALKGRAKVAGLSVQGPMGQGDFLRNLGIQTRADKVCAAAVHDDQRRDILSGLYRLTDPSQMGTLFRVLCAYHGPASMKPAGFI